MKKAALAVAGLLLSGASAKVDPNDLLEAPEEHPHFDVEHGAMAPALNVNFRCSEYHDLAPVEGAKKYRATVQVEGLKPMTSVQMVVGRNVYGDRYGDIDWDAMPKTTTNCANRKELELPFKWTEDTIVKAKRSDENGRTLFHHFTEKCDKYSYYAFGVDNNEANSCERIYSEKLGSNNFCDCHGFEAKERPMKGYEIVIGVRGASLQDRAKVVGGYNGYEDKFGNTDDKGDSYEDFGRETDGNVHIWEYDRDSDEVDAALTDWASILMRSMAVASGDIKKHDAMKYSSGQFTWDYNCIVHHGFHLGDKSRTRGENFFYDPDIKYDPLFKGVDELNGWERTEGHLPEKYGKFARNKQGRARHNKYSNSNTIYEHDKFTGELPADHYLRCYIQRTNIDFPVQNDEEMEYANDSITRQAEWVLSQFRYSNRNQDGELLGDSKIMDEMHRNGIKADHMVMHYLGTFAESLFDEPECPPPCII